MLMVQPNELAQKFQDMETVLDVNAEKTASELATYLIESRVPKVEEEGEEKEKEKEKEKEEQ